jgi:hypothetical protein
MSSIETRIAALEAQVVELKKENQLLKTMTPLASVTEGLKTASSSEVDAWMSACEMLTTKFSELVVTPEEKKKGIAKNPSGPVKWNAFIHETQRAMASALGVDVSKMDAAAMKKAAKVKGCGFSWQEAREQASRNWDAPKKPASKKALAAAAPSSPAAAPSSPAAASASPVVSGSNTSIPSEADIIAATPDATPEMREVMKSEALSYKWTARLFNGVACWLEEPSGDVFSYDFKETLGSYDAKTETFKASE